MNTTISLFTTQFRRELLIQWRQIRFLVNSCLFFLMILFIFPLTLKPDVSLMRAIAPGLVWMAMLLSLLLSAERLFTQDYEHGVIEQWLVSGQPLNQLISAKVAAHWLFNLLPLVILSPIIALIFSFSAVEMGVLLISLLCGTPALFFLCALAAAFSTGMRQKGILMALILLPLTVPVLIFGSNTLTAAMDNMQIMGQLAILLAISIVSFSFLPLAIASIIRFGLND